MALPKNECKILLSQKFNEPIWEYRLSIIENINGTNKEKVFIQGNTQEEFMENLKETLKFHELKNFARIQRYSRYSLKQKEILVADQETMKKVPQDFFNKVRIVLKTAREKMLAAA